MLPRDGHSGSRLDANSPNRPEGHGRGNDAALVIYQGVEPCYTRLSDVSLQPDGSQCIGVMSRNRTELTGFTVQCRNRFDLQHHWLGTYPVQYRLTYFAGQTRHDLSMSARFHTPELGPVDQTGS